LEPVRDTANFSADDRVKVLINYKKELPMNWDQVEGKWKQIKGSVKGRWGKLADDDLDVIAGKRDQLAGKIQERYGVTKEQAEREVEEWRAAQRDEIRREEEERRIA